MNVPMLQLVDIPPGVDEFVIIEDSCWNINDENKKDCIEMIFKFLSKDKSSRLFRFRYVVDFMEYLSNIYNSAAKNYVDIIEIIAKKYNYKPRISSSSIARYLERCSIDVIKTSYKDDHIDFNFEKTEFLKPENIEEFRLRFAEKPENFPFSGSQVSLLEAVENNWVNCVKFVLLNNKKAAPGTAVTRAAARTGNFEIVSMLREAGYKFGWLEYEECVSYHHNKLADWLAENENISNSLPILPDFNLRYILCMKDMNISNKTQWDVFDLIVRYNISGLIPVLLQNKKFFDAMSENSHHFLEQAVREVNPMVLSQILQAGICFSNETRFKDDLAFLAIENFEHDSLECLRILAQFKYNFDYVHMKDDKNHSPFSYSIIKGNLKAFDIMIQNGADINFMQGNLNVVLVAAASVSIQMVEFVLNHGANIDMKAVEQLRKFCASQDVYDFLVKVVTKN